MQNQGITHFHKVHHDHLRAKKHTPRQRVAHRFENSGGEMVDVWETIYIVGILAIFIIGSLFGVSLLLDLLFQ